jgi:hypothetical protein
LATARSRADAYSERNTADISPMGTATLSAMAEINAVPANSGTAPNEPEAPTWSARIAVCGLHCRPNRNSIGDTDWKKRNDSTSTDSTMPMVVNTATVEQPINVHRISCSTRLRARSCGVMRRSSSQPPPVPSAEHDDQQRGIGNGLAGCA